MRVLVAAVFILLQGGDTFGSGVRAYREGLFADAQQAFAVAIAAAGDEAPPEWSFDEALAALRAGSFREAEAAAERAAERGGPRLALLRDALLGNVAFQRAGIAQRQASGPEAEPFAYDVAIAYAHAARRFWQGCVMVEPDFHAARRNAERAVAKVSELEREKAAAKADSKHEGAPSEKPVDPDAEGATEKPPTDEVTERPLARPEPLTRETLEVLLDRLAQKEQEKLALRIEKRAARNATLERDW